MKEGGGGREVMKVKKLMLRLEALLRQSSD